MAEYLLDSLIAFLRIGLEQWQFCLAFVGVMVLIISIKTKNLRTTFKSVTKGVSLISLLYILLTTILAFLVFDSSAKAIFIHFVFPLSFTLLFILVSLMILFIVISMAVTAIKSTL